MQGILSPYHAYINTCASYASTPYPELLLNLKKELHGLIGHSNAGSCRMDLSGLLGALEQVWLNEGRVATIIPLKQLEKLCPVTYDSTRNGGAFICCTKDGNVMLRNNDKGMTYLDLRIQGQSSSVLCARSSSVLHADGAREHGRIHQARSQGGMKGSRDRGNAGASH